MSSKLGEFWNSIVSFFIGHDSKVKVNTTDTDVTDNVIADDTNYEDCKQSNNSYADGYYSANDDSSSNKSDDNSTGSNNSSNDTSLEEQSSPDDYNERSNDHCSERSNAFSLNTSKTVDELDELKRITGKKYVQIGTRYVPQTEGVTYNKNAPDMIFKNEGKCKSAAEMAEENKRKYSSVHNAKYIEINGKIVVDNWKETNEYNHDNQPTVNPSIRTLWGLSDTTPGAPNLVEQILLSNPDTQKYANSELRKRNVIFRQALPLSPKSADKLSDDDLENLLLQKGTEESYR